MSAAAPRSAAHRSHVVLRGGEVQRNLSFPPCAPSVVGNSGGRFIPACFDVLSDWLQEGERFDAVKCAHDAVSPCPPDPTRGKRMPTDPPPPSPLSAHLLRRRKSHLPPGTNGSAISTAALGSCFVVGACNC